MANEKNILRDQLRTMKIEEGFLNEIPCTTAENVNYRKMLDEGRPLPDGVYEYESDGPSVRCFYMIEEPELTEREFNELATLKQLKLLTTIKKCVVFFTVLTIISLVLGLLLGNGLI